MDKKKVTIKSVICAVILSLSMPVLGLADSDGKSKGRNSRKKFSKFVNGHDARDGKWDRDRGRDRDRDRDWDRDWDDRDRNRDRNRRFRSFDRDWWDNDDDDRRDRRLRRSLQFRRFLRSLR